MRGLSRAGNGLGLLSVELFLGLVMVSSPSGAQPPPAAQPPAAQPPAAPPAAPPPGGSQAPYPYPPPYGYPYPPPYGYPYPPGSTYPGYAPPAPPAPSVSPDEWQSGDPVPAGYHVEEKPRRGLVIAGSIVTGIPYTLGAFSAASAGFKNGSAWLLLPVAGPWAMIGQRDYACDSSKSETGLACLGEAFLTLALVADGIMQAAGGTLLLVGLSATKPGLVPNEQSLHVGPTRVGSGYGLGASGVF